MSRRWVMMTGSVKQASARGEDGEGRQRRDLTEALEALIVDLPEG